MRVIRFVVVVSARSGVTNELIGRAKALNPDPDEREMDMLLTVGEQETIALTAMAPCDRRTCGLIYGFSGGYLDRSFAYPSTHHPDFWATSKRNLMLAKSSSLLAFKAIRPMAKLPH